MIKPNLVGRVACFAAILFSFGTAASATTVFNHPFDPTAGKVFWCGPCSSGNSGYRVRHSFTLASNTALISLQWIGLRPDATFGVDLDIADTPQCRRGCRTVLRVPRSPRFDISVHDKEHP